MTLGPGLFEEPCASENHEWIIAKLIFGPTVSWFAATPMFARARALQYACKTARLGRTNYEKCPDLEVYNLCTGCRKQEQW